ncbi:MAG: hypothetical protein HC933_20630 [Pleurocapsa sp. SU_196_0]|nr:hypothetical protein [Pleurocapsa sp. SU_196_0]
MNLSFNPPEDLEDDSTREALLEALGHLEASVGALHGDDMGRVSLSRVSSLNFEMGGVAAVTRDGTALRVIVPSHFAQRPTQGGWRSLLESQL